MSKKNKSVNEKIIDECLKELQKDKKPLNLDDETDQKRFIKKFLEKEGDLDFLKKSKKEQFRKLVKEIEKEIKQEKEKREQESLRQTSTNKISDKIFSPLQEENENEEELIYNDTKFNKEQINKEIFSLSEDLAKALSDYQNEEKKVEKFNSSETDKKYVNNFKQYKSVIKGPQFKKFLNDLKIKKQQEYEKDPYVMNYRVPFEALYYFGSTFKEIEKKTITFVKEEEKEQESENQGSNSRNSSGKKKKKEKEINMNSKDIAIAAEENMADILKKKSIFSKDRKVKKTYVRYRKNFEEENQSNNIIERYDDKLEPPKIETNLELTTSYQDFFEALKPFD